MEIGEMVVSMLLIVFGGGLCTTGIGAVIGIPMMILGVWIIKRK
jgi:hypothetical protein